MNDFKKTAMAITGVIFLGMNSYAEDNRFIDPKTPSSSVPVGYKLVFSDEFNECEIDRKKWMLGINGQNIQNIDVACVYRWENISLRDGNLVLMQKREETPVNGKVFCSKKGIDYDYSSGGLNTVEGFGFENNMAVEIRLKLPSNTGGYAAFWGMAGENGALPEDRLEIDFFEYISDSNKQRFWSGLWWHDFHPDEIADYVPESDYFKRSPTHYFVNNQKHKGYFHPDDAKDKLERIDYDDYIRFAFKVDGNEMTWHIHEKENPLDQPPYMTFKGGDIHSLAYENNEGADDCWERHIPENLDSNLIINYAMRDFEWTGGPINDGQLPSEMLVDYIRVYQKKEVQVGGVPLFENQQDAANEK